MEWLGDAYRTRIVDTGRESLFLLLLGLLGSFLFIRFSVRMIRRGTSWWPGNVTPGGQHIHHVVFGQAFMMIGGIGVFAVRSGGRVTYAVLAVVFGIGCGLVLDEFALVLHLEDVYWKEEGRQSVDAVILAVSVIGLLLVGQLPLGGYVGGRSWTSYVARALLLGFVVLCLMKGKVWTGLLGVFLPVLAVVGALRLARPHSPWARWRYGARPRRMAKSERREDGTHRRAMALKTKVIDAVAGAPTITRPVAPRPRPTIVDLPPSRLEVVLGRVLRPLQRPGAEVAVWYLRIAAGVDIVTGLVSPFRRSVEAGDTGEYVNAFLVSPGFTAAVLAFVLSVSLRRRKRAAWVVTVVLVAAYALVTAGTLLGVPESRQHPLNWVSLGLTLLLLGALLVSRVRFNVRGERRNVALGAVSLLVGAVVAVGVGTLIVHATDQLPPRRWGVSAGYAGARVLTVSRMFAPSGVRVPAWTDFAVNVLSVALMLVVLLAFFRSPRGRARLGEEDERRLRALLRAGGDGLDSFGYFALRRDHTVCWSPDGTAAIAYRVTNGVALATGDPLGPTASWPAAIAHWLTFAARHAWVPAVAYAGRASTAAYARQGFHAFTSTEEPILTVGGTPKAPATPQGTPAPVRAHGNHGTPEGADKTSDLTEDEAGQKAPQPRPTRPGNPEPQGAPEGPADPPRPLPAPQGTPAPVRAHGNHSTPEGADKTSGPTEDEAGQEGAVGAEGGYRVVVRRGVEVGGEEWRRLGRLVGAWRGAGGGVELGRLGDPADGECVVAECLDPQGRTCALLRLVPWGADGLTLDLARADPDSGRAPLDLALTTLLRHPPAGVTRVSLNVPPHQPFAALARRTRPRFLLFTRRADLPRVLLAQRLANRSLAR